MSKITNFRKFGLALAIFAVVALGSSTAAKADQATFQLNTGSTLPNQNYGTLNLVLNGNGSITVTINLINGNRIIETGQNVSIGFNSSLGPNPAISISGLPAGYSFNAAEAPGAFGANGFGTMEYRIRSIFGANDAGALSNLSFTVFCTSCAGGVFSSVFDLVSNSTNPPGTHISPFAIDIFCPTCNGGQGATGFVGTADPVTATPEPASMILLGSGLIGVAGAARRKLKSRSSK